MATSTIPAAVDALLAAVRARPELTSVIVHDGTPITEEGAEYVAIGYSEDDVSSISARQEPATLGNRRRQETYDISGQVCAWNGGTDMKTVRDRAFALFAGVENALRADGSLAGTVIFADVGRYDVRQEQTTSGAVVFINFTVVVKITRI